MPVKLRNDSSIVTNEESVSPESRLIRIMMETIKNVACNLQEIISQILFQSFSTAVQIAESCDIW